MILSYFLVKFTKRFINKTVLEKGFNVNILNSSYNFKWLDIDLDIGLGNHIYIYIEHVAI